jgi:hypothetical protein
MNYVCIDLNNQFSQISYFNEKMKEPITLSGKIGSTRYLIPTALRKKKGLSQWFFAEEQMQDSIVIDGLLERALKKEEIFCDEELFDTRIIFSVFIRKLLSLSAAAGCSKNNSIFVFTLELVNEEIVNLLTSISEQLDIHDEQMRICTYEESFANYVMNQDKNVYANEVLLYEYRPPFFKQYRLTQDRGMIPVILSIEKRQSFVFEEMNQLSVQTTQDELFYQVALNSLNGKVVSSIFLVGNGFDGDWMEKSKQKICQGRRVFLGQNLFSKGGCFYGKWEYDREEKKESAKYLYLSEMKSQYNFCVLVQSNEGIIPVPLLDAGKNWQDAKGSISLILAESQGSASLDFVLKNLKGYTVSEYRLNLDGIANRPDKATRIKINGWMNEKHDIHIKVSDCGFGFSYPSTGKEWEVVYEQMDIK